MEKGALRFLQTAAEGLAGGILLAATMLVFTNVIGRYVFGAPIAIAEEILQYMNVWVVMLGVVIVTQRDAHLCLDLRPRSIPQVVRRLSNAAIALLAIALSGYVVVQSIKAIGFFYAVDQRSISAGIPLFFVYLVIPFSFACSLIFLLRRFWFLVSGRPEEVTRETWDAESGAMEASGSTIRLESKS